MRKLLLAALLLSLACATPKPPMLVPHPAPHEKGRLREQWMFEQRAYPFDSIPADARRNALREVEAERARLGANAAAPALSWKPLGPLPVDTNWPWGAATGRVKAVAISPADPNVIVVGSSSGGIWRSTDAGRHFVPVTDTHADLAVGSIAFAPSRPQIVYAAMGSDFLGTGMLRSEDAGATWRLVSGPTYGSRGAGPQMVIDPADPNRLWVAQYSRLDLTGTVRSMGVIFSGDGGVTWKTQLAGITSDLVAIPGSAKTLLAGMARLDGGAGNGGIWRSTNGGTTWSIAFDFGPQTSGSIRLAVTPANPNRVYAHVGSDGPAGEKFRVLVSDNAGETWKEVAAAGLSKEYSMFAAADPSNASIVFVGMRDLYRSTDGGATFVNVSNGYSSNGRFDPRFSTTHVDQHAMAFHPHDPKIVYLGNDGGLFRSTDGAVKFESLSGTLSLVQAYGIAAHPSDPAVVFLGTQDNGLERREASGRWRELITGDYGSIIFDGNDPDTLASNYVNGYILAFTKRGEVYRETLATNDTFGEGDTTRIAFIAPFEHSKLNNALYFGTYRLFISRDFGKSWVAPSDVLDLTKGSRDTLSAIGLCAGNPGVIYTGSARGRVMVSRNEGVSWNDVTGTLPNRHVRAIAVDPANPDIAYVGFSGYATAHVFRTTNGGANWTALTGGLPDVPVNALLLREGMLYAGTDIGVFRWDGSSWQYFNEGMPPVMVTDFDVTAAGTIIAATHGRGAYQLVAPTVTGKRRAVRH